MKKLLIVLGLATLLAPISVFAADFRADPEKTVTVKADESVRNLYSAGQKVDIEALVSRDLVVAGNNITVNKGCTDDLFAAGSNITVKGEVGGSARMAGSTISYAAGTGEDFIAAGNEIIIEDSTPISGDVLFAGNDLTIGNGVHVGGNVKAVGSNITLGGVIEGDVLVRDASRVVLSDNTIIRGNFVYYAEGPVALGTSAQILGQTDFHQISGTKSSFEKFKDRVYVEGLIYKIISGLLISFFLAYIFPKFSKNLVQDSASNFWSNIGWGAFVLILLPIVAIIIMTLVVTIWFSFAALLLYSLYIMLAAGALGLVLGSFIDKVVNKKKDYEINWVIILIGAFFVFLLGFVKIIGPLLLFIAFVAIFGSLISRSYTLFKKR